MKNQRLSDHQAEIMDLLASMLKGGRANCSDFIVAVIRTVYDFKDVEEGGDSAIDFLVMYLDGSYRTPMKDLCWEVVTGDENAGYIDYVELASAAMSKVAMEA